MIKRVKIVTTPLHDSTPVIVSDPQKKNLFT